MPKLLAQSFGLRDLKPVFDAAGTTMGFALTPSRSDVVLAAPPEEARKTG